MWQVIRFIVGLPLALVFAAAVITATTGTYTLAKDAIASVGDPGLFEARIRHYTDRLEVAPDGALQLVAARHPIARFVALVAGAWLVAIGALVALRRVTRSTPGSVHRVPIGE